MYREKLFIIRKNEKGNRSNLDLFDRKEINLRYILCVFILKKKRFLNKNYSYIQNLVISVLI